MGGETLLDEAPQRTLQIARRGFDWRLAGEAGS
jgi:hypothetical protein